MAAARQTDRRAAWWAAAAVALIGGFGDAYAQREFRVYPSFEGHDADAALPPGHDEPAEIVIGRLMYTPLGLISTGGGRPGQPWTVDYPRGDRTLVQMMRRFTRADVRVVEQPVSLDDGDDIFYWPYLNVGLAGHWRLSDAQAAKLREYLLRGGFLFADSFFGSQFWPTFEAGMTQVFPDRPIVDLTDDEKVFHTVFELTNMTDRQFPNMTALTRGGVGYMNDGAIPHWRGIFDDDGRLMVLIAFNNDVSDSWQWADDPRYPADAANVGLRLGVNILIYTLTH